MNLVKLKEKKQSETKLQMTETITGAELDPSENTGGGFTCMMFMFTRPLLDCSIALNTPVNTNNFSQHKVV